MARPTNSFVRALIRYGKSSPANLAQLEAWQVDAITAIAENKGGHIASGTSNGVSFTQQVSMTNYEWAGILEEVLTHIENNTRPTDRALMRVY
jgi:hypothetical protein